MLREMRQEVRKIVQAMLSEQDAHIKTVFGASANRAFMVAGATTNGQGKTGSPAIVAIAQLTCKTSGIFMWSASAIQPAAAATEVATMTVTAQSGAAAGTLAASTAVGVGCAFASGAGGTPITITAGLGVGEYTLAAPALTVGTAAVGAGFSAGGIIGVDATGARFTLGTHVGLALKWTNSATDRVVSSMCLSLVELPV
ncbi:MAG: hypothetical protein KGI71_04800 [Patescibacteria group bacterium]|nr:hypothetical protein [Patescibacteria group bacterium]